MLSFADSTAAAEDVVASLKERMEAAVRDGEFSGAVIVTKDHEPLLSAGYGFANRELEVPNTPQTKFRLGSITKQFTAMAVMILQENGKLSVEDPIGKHLENTPAAWEPITIRQLLNHTSGIPSYTGFPQMMSRTVRQVATVDEVIATFRDKELEFRPGEKFTYSNSAYILLGKIIERASGQDYETFLREAVFQPLEMNDTGYDHNQTILPQRAAGYMKSPKGYENAPYIDMTWPYSAGALYSTTLDLARWNTALDEGKLLTAESYRTMLTPGKGDYGFGWFIRDRDGRKEFGHGGGIHGFSTSIVRYPDDKVCVVVLSNVIPSRAERIASELARIALGSGAGK
jgi:CubicO group peptidase (beta-lactamase class C family)